MANTSANLVVGAPSSITISAYGVAEGSGVILGATEGGFKLTYNPTHFYKKADQWTGQVGAVKTDEEVTLEFVLAEVSLANLAYAMGYPTTAVSSKVILLGINGAPPIRAMNL